MTHRHPSMVVDDSSTPLGRGAPRRAGRRAARAARAAPRRAGRRRAGPTRPAAERLADHRELVGVTGRPRTGVFGRVADGDGAHRLPAGWQL